MVKHHKYVGKQLYRVPAGLHITRKLEYRNTNYSMVDMIRQPSKLTLEARGVMVFENVHVLSPYLHHKVYGLDS
jgi:hypothetical protein